MAIGRRREATASLTESSGFLPSSNPLRLALSTIRTVSLTSAQRRILDRDRNLVSSSFDWTSTDFGGAVWDSANEEIYTSFGSTSSGLNIPGQYFVQLRGTIGTEKYTKEIIVQVLEVGP